jgi:hypothetical protein
MQPFRRIFTNNEDLSKVQNAIEQSLAPINNSAIIDGVLITGVALTTANAQISHTLDRIPLGYIVVGSSAYANVKDAARDSKTITLSSSATTTISLWVF